MIHHRHSIRLKEYDYSQPGAYFVTIVTRVRECLFGDVSNGVMRLNKIGQLTSIVLLTSAQHINSIVDTYIIMPNHLHAILIITERELTEIPKTNRPTGYSQDESSRLMGTKPGSLGAIIQNFKSVSTRRINALRGTPGVPVWQRNYYGHVIRNEHELDHVRQYIVNDPYRWADDEENRPLIYG